MKTGNRMGHVRGTKLYAVLAATVVLAAVLGVAAAGCDSGEVKNIVTGGSSGQSTWGGNGGDIADECDYTMTWVLTAGSNSISNAMLYVDFGSGYQSYSPSKTTPGATQFTTPGDSVVAAYATYNYTGEDPEPVLTISHCNVPDGTTTTEEEVTTTTEQETTTTEGETTTTEGETTTTARATTTTVAEVTSTTESDNGTTTTAVGELTSTTVSDPGTTTTVVGDLTTAGRIDTGGGGTAGPNIMLWLTVSLLGVLAVALGGSAIWTGLKQKGGR